jgi:bifunctional non-homologous end joining protein LigD
MADTSTRRPAALTRYKQKRNFGVTPEPAGVPAKRTRKRVRPLSFVIQKHWASRLHYDFRLELDGVLVSWAVPKGPSYDPKKMQMAIHVEDHPLDYADFEGTIPPKQYGAGTVITWDRGTWEPVGDPKEGLRKGKLLFKLHGEKLAGLWELVRIAKPGDRQDRWMLFKKRDEWARPLAEYDVIAALPDSVVARPLGPVEQREPRSSAPRVARVAGEADAAPDLAAAVPSPLPAKPSRSSRRSFLLRPGDWIVETKFDGCRLLPASKAGRLFTRGGHWTSRMPSLAKPSKRLASSPDGSTANRRPGEAGIPDSMRCRTPSTPRRPARSSTSFSTCLISMAAT